MKLYVGNLPFSATEDEIRSMFEDFGGAVDLHIPLDRETGRPRGFAFVTLSSKEQGEAAIGSLDGKDMGGRALRISEAQERAPRGGGGGGGGGGNWGGGGGGDRRGGGGGDRRGGGGDRRGGGGGGGSRRGRSKQDGFGDGF
ncbi:MAG TPA: RNA-binding protein [Verrucomicrobiales bacterium]|nr:RNA-binding protein [Roseibacillus sp.]HBM78744.1 RNA-binding protein [Verrucomicrobiales bacterium]HCQ37636.1 RNA-binding protein [Verrucomicrobiales bacterium]